MTGVKFRPGSPSIPGERVASGLVWRFGTLDCVSDNLACFGDGFGGSGSFLDIGSHCFYVTKPFPEEVTDVLDPLSDGGSSYGKSCDFGTMVKVMALGDEEGGDPPRSVRPPLERLPLQEQNAPLPEHDTSDVAVVDLRTPLDRVIDPARVVEALERTRLSLLSRAAREEAARHHMSTTLREFYDAHGDAPDELVRASSAAMDSTPRALARSSGPHRQARASEGADRAVAPRAVTPEDTVSSRPVELEGHAQSRHRCQGWSLKFASRPCTSIYGLTT
jgi:hypothetical protein